MAFGKKKKTENVNHHFIFIEVPVRFVAPIAMHWGESDCPWWPEKCLTVFEKETPGEVAVGTVYKQKIQKPMAPSWKVEVTKLRPNRLIERTFKSGMFKGYEIISIEERANGTRIDYELHYRINGIINLVLWPFLFRRQHDENIRMILRSLKKYVTDKYHKEAEGDAK